MIVILDNQLGHLADGIGVSGLHMPGDIGDLRPDDHARLVTEIVEILRVLIVSQTHRVRSHLQHDLQILPVHLGRDGVADAWRS